MTPAKATARLNAKIQSQERGLGGPEFTTEDILLARSFITSEGALLLSLVKYARQDGYRTALINCVMLDILARAPRDGWIPPLGDELLKVATAAVHEAIDPPMCPDCQGRTWKIVGLPSAGRPAKGTPPRRQDCDRCHCTGRIRPSTYWRWKKSGMGRKRLGHWLPWYDRTIMPILDNYESEYWRGMRLYLQQE